MEPSEIETNFRLILQICEKNTTDISKLIANQDKLTQNQEKLMQNQEKLVQNINRLAQIQLAQTRDIAHLTDYIARDDQ